MKRSLQSERGFTMLELMVIASLFVVLAMVATPTFRDYKQVFDRINAQNSLFADLKRAQAEAVTQGCRGIFVISPGQNSYTFGCDYLDYDPADPPSHDDVSFRRNFPPGITISVDAPIIFNSRGQTVDTAGIISALSIQLIDSTAGSPEVFAQGLLNGTGVFSYD